MTTASTVLNALIIVLLLLGALYSYVPDIVVDWKERRRIMAALPAVALIVLLVVGVGGLFDTRIPRPLAAWRWVGAAVFSVLGVWWIKRGFGRFLKEGKPRNLVAVSYMTALLVLFWGMLAVDFLATR